MNTLLKMQVEELGNELGKLTERDRTFAASLCDQYWSRGLSAKQAFWVDKLLSRTQAPAPTTPVTIGDLAGVLALFTKAKQHLKWPAIVLAVPLSTRADFAIRITVAGPRARFPGSLNVTSLEKDMDGRRGWLGRIHTDGRYEASDGRDLGNTDPEWATKVQDKLKALAADPVAVASEHGRLTGHCCFCNLPLKDERSTGVGYGPICADHYGLPWGARPAEFAAGSH